ncbi:hypothetical protein SEPCBS119000_002942 [Sporothrix epigloea]|uniref:Uncharacterized protein n=1 Tax=Sporothrix epigloea TaxID=1892477 RepID=A0ABP0DMH1_9PEZI
MAARAAAKAEAAAARAASRAAAKAQKAAAKNKVAPVANGGMSVQVRIDLLFSLVLFAFSRLISEQAESKPNVQQDDFSLSQPTGHSSPAAMPAAAFSPVVKMEEFDTMESLSQQLSAEPVVEQSFTEMLYGSESEDQDSFMTQAFDDEFEQFFKPEPIKQEPVDEQAYAVPTAAPYTTSLLTGPVTDITLPSFPLMFGAGYTDLEDNLSFSPGPANPFAHNYVQDLNSLYSPQLCPCQDFQCPPRNWPMQNVVRLGWCPVRDMPTLFLETLPAMASNGQFMAQYPGQAFGH